MTQQPPVPADAPICICRSCGGVMEACYQPPLMPGRVGHWLLTCRNVCPLNKQTFISNTYASIDLTSYLTKTLPTAEVPCTCRSCGGTLDAKFQATGLPDKPGYWLLTCWNPDCELKAVTRTALTYATFDLAPYLVKETSK
jgi:hypothetical protein